MENPRLMAALWISCVMGVAMSLLGITCGNAQDFFGLDLAYDSLFLLIVAIVSGLLAGEMISNRSQSGPMSILFVGVSIPLISIFGFILLTYFFDAIGVLASSGALGGNLGMDIAQSVQLLRIAYLIFAQFWPLALIGLFATWSLTAIDSIISGLAQR